MFNSKPNISSFFRRTPSFFGVVFLICLFSEPAHASIVDAFNLSPFVPLVLETMMNIATSLYKYFVGNGTGLIYILIYLLLGFYIGLYLVKLYLPKDWASFLGFSDAGGLWDGKLTGWSIAENVAKPCLRAIIAILVLLQIKPVYVTNWLVNPFLEFGALYTESILKNVNNSSFDNVNTTTCPESIESQGWISKRSCDFLIKPVDIISKENNRVIKYGLDLLKRGLAGLMTLIPHGGENILNIISGFVLLTAFISANVFMALLIIQAIFDFCLALIMYPFNVLAWVAKKSDVWFDIFPAFNQIIDALKKLVITMIACAFILCINVALVRALFNWSTSVFIVSAGGVASSNVPSITNSAMNFGQHSILWISSLLTFYLMQNIFKMTRERLELYAQTTSHDKDLYTNISTDAKTMWDKAKNAPDKMKTIWQAGKKIMRKK